MSLALPRQNHGAGMFDFLNRDRIIATAGFNRWTVPPAALAIHLCIGMAYGFSVFWLPLSRAIGISSSIACPAGSGLLDALFTTSCDWKISDLGWMFTLSGVGFRNLRTSALADVAGLRPDRRHWSGARLYLAGIDAGEMVS
jgi:hypothetical protein